MYCEASCVKRRKQGEICLNIPSALSPRYPTVPPFRRVAAPMTPVAVSHPPLYLGRRSSPTPCVRTPPRAGRRLARQRRGPRGGSSSFAH
eukprot:4796503-Prymnesium_polylepis.1